jgi:hypothetical protein
VSEPEGHAEWVEWERNCPPGGTPERWRVTCRCPCHEHPGFPEGHPPEEFSVACRCGCHWPDPSTRLMAAVGDAITELGPETTVGILARFVWQHRAAAHNGAECDCPSFTDRDIRSGLLDDWQPPRPEDDHE